MESKRTEVMMPQASSRSAFGLHHPFMGRAGRGASQVVKRCILRCRWWLEVVSVWGGVVVMVFGSDGWVEGGMGERGGGGGVAE